MAEHNITGKAGETLAADFLRSNGYEVYEINWRWKQYEIDIIAKKDNILIVAEVKTRHSNALGEPEAWVTRAKQKNLIKGAQQYILSNDLDVETRFDIISVLYVKGMPQVNHIADAFYPTL